MATKFIGYPTGDILDARGGKRLDQALWGTGVTVLDESDPVWTQVGPQVRPRWVRRASLQDHRLLEVAFVDIGQGDGCFIRFPDDRMILIDAGEGDNMHRFLRWRFGLDRHPERVIDFHAAVITHADTDHYRGFADIFDDPQFRFAAIYHNGLVERAGGPRLGGHTKVNGVTCQTAVVTNLAELQAIVNNPALRGKMVYPNMLKKVLDSGRVGDARMLSSLDGYFPGFGAGQPVEIQVLGPVPEPNLVNGKPVLRRFENDGKTKNGHSIILKLRHGRVQVLLGGDLNTEAEHHLLRHYTGLDPAAAGTDRSQLIAQARNTFQVDVYKACHHGSADFTQEFLDAVHPMATVISSGDDEPHAHPRPDTLGAVGKAGRGARPLIFSTELARSAKEAIKRPSELREELHRLQDKIEEAGTEDQRKRAEERFQEALEKIERTVQVYGMINLRSDGEKVLMAYKLEQKADRGEWDYYCLEPNAAGELELVMR